MERPPTPDGAWQKPTDVQFQILPKLNTQNYSTLNHI